MSQPDYQPPKPFETSMQSWTSGALDDWPNTVTISAVTTWDAHAANEDGDTGAARYADMAGEREMVQIDTNYKPTRTSEHPVRLTRVDAIHLAAHVLTAAEDTFHFTRRGQLRATEAADVLRVLEEVNYAVTNLRGHALDDLLHDTGIATTELDEPEPSDTPSTTAAEEATDEHSEATEATGVKAAVREVFPVDVAQQIEASDAFAALVYRVEQQAAATGQTPAQVLHSLDSDDRSFAGRANEPAAFLAAKVRDLDHEVG